MLDQWLKQRGVSFRKASLIQDKKKRESWGCLPVCSFIKPSLTETSQLGPFFHPTQWRAPLFAKVSAPGAGPRSQSHGQKQNRERQTLRERHRTRKKKWKEELLDMNFANVTTGKNFSGQTESRLSYTATSPPFMLDMSSRFK